MIRPLLAAGAALLAVGLGTTAAGAVDDDPLARSATGPTGQTLVVTPAIELDPAGAEITVTGTGYDEAVGIYVALCVDQGAATPSPCVGGVDMSGESVSAAWITSDPPPYGVELSDPFDPGGSFAVALTIVAQDEYVDCLDGETTCVLATRADHTDGANRSADVKVPVYFVGQDPPDPGPDPEPEPEPEPEPAASAVVGQASVTAGEALAVSGSGFLAGEQVQVLLQPGDRAIGLAVADDAGAVSGSVPVPADVAAGPYTLELFGITSATRATSATFEVLAAPPVATTPPGTTPGTAAPVRAATTAAAPTGAATLPATGFEPTLLIAGLALVLGGALLHRWARLQPTTGSSR